MKILVQFKDNTILFKQKKRLTTEYKTIINTNIISDNELVFSDDYIKKSSSIVKTFLKNLTNEYKIKICIFDNYEISELLLDILKDNKNIKHLIFKEENPLPFNICSTIMKMTNIETISVYALQDFMMEYLDEKNIKVESRNEILFLSSFMEKNKLNKISSIYYKKEIYIDFPLSNSDIDDFMAFCAINKYLKNIKINKVSKKDLELLLNIVHKNKLKNIKIIINDDINDIKIIEYLKNINKIVKKDKISLSLNYSKTYIEDNIMPETNNNILKICLFIIIMIIVFSFSYVFVDNIISLKNVNEMQNDIISIMESNDVEYEFEEPILNEEIGLNKEKTIVNSNIASLLSINAETVGWLKINNTKIDYAVVKADNNSYYLDHNFKKEKDNNGWVFMDYRNDSKDLDDNTIFYAHNRYASGVMFGTLKNVLEKSWYTNPDNLIISYNSLYENMNFKIFSIYKIDVTTDYLNINFNNNLDRLEFYQMLKNRSIYSFDTPINNDDKIITLSTCISNNTQRLVVHAVLIK